MALWDLCQSTQTRPPLMHYVAALWDVAMHKPNLHPLCFQKSPRPNQGLVGPGSAVLPSDPQQVSQPARGWLANNSRPFPLFLLGAPPWTAAVSACSGAKLPPPLGWVAATWLPRCGASWCRQMADPSGEKDKRHYILQPKTPSESFEPSHTMTASVRQDTKTSGKVMFPHFTPHSYFLDSPSGTIRRDREHLLLLSDPTQTQLSHSTHLFTDVLLIHRSSRNSLAGPVKE